jgi:hypothetical protein
MVASVARTVRVLPLRKGLRPVIASGRTQVLDPSVVSSVPAPGRSGKLVYAGGNDVQVGQIVAIGAGAATPDGFLGRVTKVVDVSGATVVSTVPATLLQAVPSGSLDATARTVSASEARVSPFAHASANVTCSGSLTAQITQSMSFSAGIALKGSWTLFGGLQNASLTADASAKASLKAVAAAAGACKLKKTSVLSFPGPSVETFVGPVPVVMTSKITVYLDADASVKASTTTSASAGFSASAGIGWGKSRGFYPIRTFNSRFGFNPPLLSANATVDANLTPTIDVLLYGAVGPQLALRSGLAFNADISKNPWWTLTAPVNLTASIAIPPLKLSSPTLHVYQHSFSLANAAGPFGGVGGGGNASVSATNPGNQSGTVRDSVRLQIQASDSQGNSLTYTASGLPAGLSIDSSTGLISGTLTTPGSSTVTVTATDGAASATATFAWAVAAGQARHITSYAVSPDLGCTLSTSEDNSDEFYNNGASNDACGTFLALGGVLYGPGTVPAGQNLGTYTPWTPVSQSTTGSGSAGDPFTTITTVAAAGTGVELTETDTWTAGGSSVDSSMALSGASGDTSPVLLYRAADCYVGNSDIGTGGYDPATQTVTCLHDNGDGTQTAEQLIPLSPGASSVEDNYSTIWSDLASQAALPNTCQCTNSIDNGAATAWSLQLNGTAAVSASSRWAFTTTPGP